MQWRGSIVDKREYKKVNNEVVNLMREDFLANYKKDPDLFVKFSPRSQDGLNRLVIATIVYFYQGLLFEAC